MYFSSISFCLCLLSFEHGGFCSLSSPESCQTLSVTAATATFNNRTGQVRRSPGRAALQSKRARFASPSPLRSHLSALAGLVHLLLQRRDRHFNHGGACCLGEVPSAAEVLDLWESHFFPVRLASAPPHSPPPLLLSLLLLLIIADLRQDIERCSRRTGWDSGAHRKCSLGKIKDLRLKFNFTLL